MWLQEGPHVYREQEEDGDHQDLVPAHLVPLAQELTCQGEDILLDWDHCQDGVRVLQEEDGDQERQEVCVLGSPVICLVSTTTKQQHNVRIKYANSKNKTIVLVPKMFGAVF